jgi:hypothetical protein
MTQSDCSHDIADMHHANAKYHILVDAGHENKYLSEIALFGV